MTIPDFIKSLKSTSRAEALEQIQGAIWAAETVGPPLSPEDRALLARARVAILSGRTPEA